MPLYVQIVILITLAWVSSAFGQFSDMRVAYVCDPPLAAQSPPHDSLYQKAQGKELEYRFDKSQYCTVWIRQTLTNPGTQSQVLMIRYPTLDWARPWINGQPLQAAGAAIPLPHHPLGLRFPTWLIQVDSGTHTLDLAVIDSTGKRRAPLHLIPINEFIPQLESKTFLDGVLIGWLLFHVVLALILFYILGKNSGAIYYFAYVATSTGYQAVASGHAFGVLWPNTPQINNFIQMMFALLPMPFATLWMLSFQNVRAYYPRLNRVMHYYSFIMVGLALSMICMLNANAHHMIQALRNSGFLELLTMIMGITIFSITIWILWQKRLWESKIVLAGLGFHMGATLVAFAHDLGMVVMEVSTRTRVLQSGLVFEFFILSGALALRLHRSQKHIQDLEIKFSTAVVKTADQERERLARELHDDIGQRVVALQFQMYNDSTTAKEKNSQPMEQVKIILQRLRQMAHSLHPPQLISGKLGDAVENHAMTLQNAGVCDFTVSLDKKTSTMGGDPALHILRIIQEATSNALRHAKSTRIDIGSFTHSDQHFISISNNGKPMPVPYQEGMGLTGIRARLRLLNGTLQIESPAPSTNEGARLILSFATPQGISHASHTSSR